MDGQFINIDDEDRNENEEENITAEMGDLNLHSNSQDEGHETKPHDDIDGRRYEVLEEQEGQEEEEEEEDDDCIDFDEETAGGNITKRINASIGGAYKPNTQRTCAQKWQPHDKVLMNRICVGSSSVSSGCIKNKDKADYATAERVIDQRTRTILFKMLDRQIITSIDGCLSTGKEANVYRACSESGDMAVKIYETTNLVFKDREQYVDGEFRFRRGYCKSNSRKMVQTWAEKEMRNLIRIHKSGLPCPEPIQLRSHVLVMRFIGKNGLPAPRLEKAPLTEAKSRDLYMQCVKMVRILYRECKLVHGDFSEYNLLVHEGILYLIDVSQSVEHDHPHALEFLRKDLLNVTDFFRKQGVSVMTLKELFHFVTDVNITDDRVEEYLEEMQKITSERIPGS